MTYLARRTKSTPRMCRLFYKFGRQHNAALRQWYSFGVAVAAMLSMSVMFMLLQDVWLAIAWVKEVCLQQEEVYNVDMSTKLSCAIAVSSFPTAQIILQSICTEHVHRACAFETGVTVKLLGS